MTVKACIELRKKYNMKFTSWAYAVVSVSCICLCTRRYVWAVNLVSVGTYQNMYILLFSAASIQRHHVFKLSFCKDVTTDDIRDLFSPFGVLILVSVFRSMNKNTCYVCTAVMINPRHACAARVTVLCVCVFFLCYFPYTFIRRGSNVITIFIRMDAVATITFKSAEARRLFEGGYYSRATFIMYRIYHYQNTGRDQGKRACTADDEAMASQVEEASCLFSVVRGHHVYKAVWTPFLGEILTAIAEPGNNHDRHAVCEERGRNRRSCTMRAVADGVALFDAWRTTDLWSEWKEKVREWTGSPLCI